MEPDVIRLYSSSPPPLEDGEEEDEDEFGDFGAFSTVSASISFGELDAHGRASFPPDATSPPELLNGLAAVPGTRHEAKANAVPPVSHPTCHDCSDVKRPDARVAGGDGGEIITNGFTAAEVKPGPQTFAGCHAGDNASEGADGLDADFDAFSDTGRQLGTAHGDGVCQGGAADRTGPDAEATPFPGSCDTRTGAESSDDDFAHDTTPAHAKQPPAATGDRAEDGVNGVGGADVDDVSLDAVCVDGPHVEAVWVEGDGGSVDGGSVDGGSVDGGSVDGGSVDGGSSPGDGLHSDGRTSETETSLGRPLSTDALEEYVDVSTTASAPSPPPLLEENADHSQVDEEEEEEFGDFGDGGSLGDQSFADFNHKEACLPQTRDDFNADEEGGASSSARWNAFEEEEEAGAAEWTTGESWAAFSSEDDAHPAGVAVEENSSVDNSRHAEALWSRVEKLLEASFPQAAGPSPAAEERVPSLKTLVEARQDVSSALGGGVWPQLRDVHEAVGLRHQWGGSYCNKTLLGCLGIDTRNILFTGQKKQPLIVPVYAASLGMLEPTKEPAKPVSAAEMIASIAQAAAPAPDGNSCSPDVIQEALPPVQFDWSTSGLTNPLDGVDPELVELTTAKMDSGGAGGRVVDAFARLMSTMDKTSTSTRKTRKDEKLSSEAAQVICRLPDLSFMTAKVLMFPATLMPLASQATPD
ncbi:aftiphilin a isoform X2 [Vanacampus margaritifer]